ncbi:hypothetical protein [Halococcus sp. AFM35]|uniref:hypothetical protein n=1 Tax=Halococcus sp. AFM35 TaxID=3421653 RepID=UPI003EBFDE1C
MNRDGFTVVFLPEWSAVALEFPNMASSLLSVVGITLVPLIAVVVGGVIATFRRVGGIAVILAGGFGFLLGWPSLAIVVGFSRIDVTRFAIAQWSRSKEWVDKVMLAIVSNGVLALSVVVAEIVWRVTDRAFVST